MCFPDLRACLNSETEIAKELPRFREKQTRQKGVKKNKNKNEDLLLFQDSVLNWKQIGWKSAGNNRHSNPSNKKYFYKAGSRPLISLARKAEGSIQHTS